MPRGSTEIGRETTDRRAEIIAAAVKVLACDGIAATTTRKIAAAAGVNQAMLGYYFGSKDDLLLAVLQELMQQTQQIVLDTSVFQQAQDDVRVMIAESITAFWESVEREPDLQVMQLELTLYVLRQPSSAWLAKQQYAGYCDVVARLFREGYAAAGRECAVPFDDIARFVIGGLDGLILQFISDHDTARARRDLGQLIAAVIALAEGAAQSRPASYKGVSFSSRRIISHERGRSVQRDYSYYRQIFEHHAKPFAYVDLDLLDQNIRQVASQAGGKRVRLASKSIRCVAMLRRIFAADQCFQGIMCYTAREAVWLAGQGFDDLLVGYPAWNPDDISAVADAVAAGKQIALMVDSVEHVKQIESVAGGRDVRLPVCLEVDLSIDVPGLHFGVWRSPVRSPAQARPVVESIVAAPHLKLDGIMGYEAQVAGLGDNFPGMAVQNRIVRVLKRRSVKEAAARRAAIIDLIASYGISLRFVNGGGTGSLATTREEAGVTEITVGSGFYSPALFDNYRDFRYLPAAGFAIEIVRRPRPDLFTCLGGGYIASGSTGPEKQPQPYLPQGAKLLPREGAGEVQTPVRYSGPEKLSLGDPIFMRHSKAGEVCEHFARLELVSEGQIVDQAETYRGAGQIFL